MNASVCLGIIWKDVHPRSWQTFQPVERTVCIWKLPQFVKNQFYIVQQTEAIYCQFY